MREVLNAIRHLVRSGCAWSMLPIHFPPWQTVCRWFRRLATPDVSNDPPRCPDDRSCVGGPRHRTDGDHHRQPDTHGEESLTEHQTETVYRFILACPEMRDDQVRDWSARQADLAEEFKIFAETLHEEREHLELEKGDPVDETAERQLISRRGLRLFSIWQTSLRIAEPRRSCGSEASDRGWLRDRILTAVLQPSSAREASISCSASPKSPQTARRSRCGSIPSWRACRRPHPREVSRRAEPRISTARTTGVRLTTCRTLLARRADPVP